YFAAGKLPSISTPNPAEPPQHVPGFIPNKDGLNDILFALHSIHCSSRYGRIIELVFRIAEDYEFDARNGSTLSDCPNRQLRVYRGPPAWLLNVQGVAVVPVPAELLPGKAQAYTLCSHGDRVTPIGSDGVKDELDKLLAQTAELFSAPSVAAFAASF